MSDDSSDDDDSGVGDDDDSSGDDDSGNKTNGDGNDTNNETPTDPAPDEETTLTVTVVDDKTGEHLDGEMSIIFPRLGLGIHGRGSRWGSSLLNVRRRDPHCEQ